MKTPLFSEQKHYIPGTKVAGQGGGVNLAGRQPVYHEISRLGLTTCLQWMMLVTRIIHCRLCCNLYIYPAP